MIFMEISLRIEVSIHHIAAKTLIIVLFILCMQELIHNHINKDLNNPRSKNLGKMDSKLVSE